MAYRQSQQSKYSLEDRPSSRANPFVSDQDYYEASHSQLDRRPTSTTLRPSDSASQVGDDEPPSRVNQYAAQPDYLSYDPYSNQHSARPQSRASRDVYSYDDQPHHEQDPSTLPLVHFAGSAAGHAPQYENERQSYLGKQGYSPVQSAEEFDKYPPYNKDVQPEPTKLEAQTAERPPVWQRLLRDKTPLEQRIENHKRGIGVQARPWLCWILSAGMVIALIAEMGQNWRYTGTPIAIKPNFNYMIGPSANILIFSGARFTPCIKNIPDVSDQNFACLNNTASIPSTFCQLSDICGFGGFPTGQANQSFRFILPIFLHAGLVHILFNLLVQCTASAQIEREMGSLRFAVLYFSSGIFGFVLGGNFALVGQPSVGASGAIYGTQAAVFVDLMAHWRIERKPVLKLVYLIVELVIGFGIGFIPNTIDNFSHIGGFAMGLCVSLVLYPAIHQTKRHRIMFYGLRAIAFPAIIILFVVLIRNFYTSDPSKACSWCRYLSCWPTAANNHCQGTGLTIVTSTTSSSAWFVWTISMLFPFIV